jgi:F0F1-type ATP synthase assembly protein I
MKKSLFFAFTFIGTIGIATATPAVALGLTGRYLDKHFNTSPKIFIVFMLLALVLSLLVLKKIAKRAIKDMDKLNN